MTVQRDFKGVWIPREVWLDERLSALDKVILTEIDSLDQGERGCYASNQHLADFCQCSARKVSDAVAKLIECGYVRVESFDGRKRTLRSCLSSVRGRVEESARQDSKKCEAESQNLLQSNTSSKTATNTSKKERKSARSFDEIINAYTDDASTRELLGMWLQNRKAKRAAMTDNAIMLNLRKLDDYAKQSGMTVGAYLQEVIRRGWSAFFPINTYGKSSRAPQQQKPMTEENRETIAALEEFTF